MIVATTLSGNSQAIIADAIRSAIEQVDHFLLVDTGITDDTADIVRAMVGDRLTIRKFRWRDDFSAARNFALEEAGKLGEWAVTLDTDERFHFEPGFDLRKKLAAYTGTVLLVQQVDGSYHKERIFKVPTTMRYAGPTHEAIRNIVRGSILRGMRFSELAKTPEQLERKHRRDKAALEAWVKVENQPRWWFHLGTTYQALKMYDEAIEAYLRCAAFRGWKEESSWAMFMAAQCHCIKERWIDAMECCIRGLNLKPDTRELAWLAGYAAYKAGEYESAVAWSKIAIAIPDDPLRIGFRDWHGYTAGPWEILYYAHHALGHAAEAAEAKERLDQMRGS